jgi:hypothetical protein
MFRPSISHHQANLQEDILLEYFSVYFLDIFINNVVFAIKNKTNCDNIVNCRVVRVRKITCSRSDDWIY